MHTPSAPPHASVANEADAPYAAETDSTGAHAAVLGEDAMDAMEGLPELEVNLGPTTESNLYVGISGDVGRGGVFAATYERLALGSQVALRLTFAGGLETRAVGVVRFVRDGFEADDTPGLGIKFAALTADGHALVRRFASHREPALLSE